MRGLTDEKGNAIRTSLCCIIRTILILMEIYSREFRTLNRISIAFEQLHDKLTGLCILTVLTV